MSERSERMMEPAGIGLAIATLACAPPPAGFTLDEAGDDPSGTDPSGTDTGADETSGETGPNDIPFEIVFGALNATGKFVVLRFSEPVGPVEAVDPSDFRISFARVVPQCDYYGNCTYNTMYWDPNFFAAIYQYGYGGYSDVRFEVDLVTAGAQPTDVFLRFGTPLEPVLCEAYGGYQDDYEILFVHYSPGEIPVKSLDDESLPAIGMQWVEQPGPNWFVNGEFPNLAPKIAIPCTL